MAPPNAGDVHWVELDPVRGTEQAGRRPALILTSAEYHVRARRVLICPVTRNMREWTFHVPIPPGLRIQGAIMIDQIRMIDREERCFDYIDTLPDAVLAEVRGRMKTLVGIT